MASDPTALIRDVEGGSWLSGSGLVQVLSASSVAEVLSVLARVEAALESGRYAVGFLTYEAAPAMDPALVTHLPGILPLAWFAVYDSLVPAPPPDFPRGESECTEAWCPSVSRQGYDETIQRIRRYLAAGDTYQVNYTFPLQAEVRTDPMEMFRRMAHAQPTEYGAFIETDDFAICSVSPELFIRRSGTELLSRPMKGTAARGMTLAEDREQAARLCRSVKNRAENVMIVDMIRNDMGRIAQTGTVAVSRMHHVTHYPTILQMTSDVCCKTDASLTSLMRALFPCASITGAPKVRTMQIIRELETTPRGIYTGAIGFCRPGGELQFSVAIRTATIDKRSGVGSYGVGGGVVWDSVGEQEYNECLLKAAVLSECPPAFSLLETILWEGESGYFLLEEHLSRLRESAEYFSIPLDAQRIVSRLMSEVEGMGTTPRRVRVLVDRAGGVQVESSGFAKPSETSPRWRVGFASIPVSARDVFLYHKTTNRQAYDHARAERPDLDDVLLWNEAGLVTESTLANIVIRRGGDLLTPPLDCGLLGGTFRRTLLESRDVREEAITRADVRGADEVFLINSVRRWVPAELVWP